MKFGKVALVGAGPGDPGLLTLRGQQLLASADVVLYDGLINTELLHFARPTAQVLCVGKHGHGGMWTQQEIDDRTVAFAKQGKSVVRLKGGDTAIFARTAEEVDRLISEGISYEIVPGITAALAATAYAGIPLTHRDWASAVALVTGQLQPADGSNEAEEGIDWRALAAFPGTLVLYMGVTTAPYWSQRLIAFGKSPHTPVALVRRVSWHDQRIVRCELGHVAETLQSLEGFRPPVISIVGDVVGMAQPMNWFRDRPLFGKRFLIASSESTGRKLQAMLEELGASTVSQPALQIQRTTLNSDSRQILRSIASFDWLVFSSPIGVQCFFEELLNSGLDVRSLGSCKIASVGTATSAALSQYHLVADRTPQQPGIENLVTILAPEIEGKRVLFIRNEAGRHEGIDAFRIAGAECHSLLIYEQVPVVRWPDTIHLEIAKNQLDGVIVTSQNIADQACRLIGDVSRKQRWYALSNRVAESLRALNCNSVVTAKRADLSGLVDAIVSDNA